MLKIFFFFHSWLFQHYLGTYLGSKKIKFCTWTFFPLFQTHFIAWILHSYRNRWFDMCTSISCKKRVENCALSFYCFYLFFLNWFTRVFLYFLGWYYIEKLGDGQKGWVPMSATREIESNHIRARNFKQRHAFLKLLTTSMDYIESNDLLNNNQMTMMTNQRRSYCED